MNCYFGEEDMKVLKSVSGLKVNDRTFVRKTLEILYRGEEEKLPYRGLRGCPEGIIIRNGKKFFRERKRSISAEKRMILNETFRKRINTLDIPLDEKCSRVGQEYVKSLTKLALQTLRENQLKLGDLSCNDENDYQPMNDD